MNLVRPLSVAGLIAIAAVGLTALPAAAHTPAASADCSTLTVHLVSYETSGNDATPNRLVATVDGATVADSRFGTGTDLSYNFTDSSVAHDWTVTVDALGTAYDTTFTGTSEPCVVSPPLAATAELSVSEPTCDDPARLSLGALSNATWGEPTRTTGPGDYSVTATATNDALFDNGTNTLTFNGSLKGTLDSTLEPCVVEPPTVVPPAQPDPIVETAFVEDVECEDEVVTRTTTTTRTEYVLDTAANTWVLGTPVTTTEVTTRAAEFEDCPIVSPPPAVEPPTDTPPADTPGTPPSNLATTGADPAAALGIAGLLAASGAALFLRPRRSKLTRL